MFSNFPDQTFIIFDLYEETAFDLTCQANFLRLVYLFSIYFLFSLINCVILLPHGYFCYSLLATYFLIYCFLKNAYMATHFPVSTA